MLALERQSSGANILPRQKRQELQPAKKQNLGGLVQAISETGTAVSERRVTRFVRNLWYCAGWAHELAEDLLPRKILGDPILMFRDDDGDPHAIVNLCSHKLAPLHLGKRVGNAIECGYHGLQFDGHGKCVFNPQNAGRTPAAADIRAYPLVERDEILWIWMGDPARADERLIPDCSYMVAPDRKTIRGRIHLQGNYLLLVDNLMDLGHAFYLHQGSAGGLTNRHYEIEVGQEGDVVFDRRIARNLPGPRFLTKWLDDAPEDVCDHWMDISWRPAGVMRNHVAASPAGSTPPGSNRVTENVIDQIGTHLVTPESTRTTHYFCANSRNYALDDPAVDQFWRDWQRKALQDEDSAMIEEIERMREDAIAVGMAPMPFLQSDGSGVRVTRIIDRLITEEIPK